MADADEDDEFYATCELAVEGIQVGQKRSFAYDLQPQTGVQEHHVEGLGGEAPPKRAAQDRTGLYPTVLCKCPQPTPAIVKTSNTEKNNNRDFYKCARCDFFQWCDQGGSQLQPTSVLAPKETSYGTGDHSSGYKGVGASYGDGTGDRGAYSGGYGGNANTYGAGAGKPAYGTGAGGNASGGRAYGRGGYGEEEEPRPDIGLDPLEDEARLQNAPKCGCGIAMMLKTSNSANNPGRQFYACTKEREDPTRCGYFNWADEPLKPPRQATGVAGAGGSTAGAACFTCGKEGHWSRDCPQKQGGGGGGGQFGAAKPGGGNDTCFKCGQTGHWSSKCPNQGGGGAGYGGGLGGDSGGGGGGGFYGTYGAKQAGSGYGSYGGNSAGKGSYGGGGASGACFKCGGQGHFSRDCRGRG